jgi:hypothetical protein
LRVFISYHTLDRAAALGLQSAIKAALPVADVFVNQTHLRYGHLWQPALSDAIAKAQACHQPTTPRATAAGGS